MSDRVEALLAEMTVEEKAAMTAGIDMWHATGVERLGVRGLKVTDGPNGARGSYWVGTTSACLPCGTALGATWDTELVRELGDLLGREARTKGADLLLAPTVNIHRSPLAGRNFECFSEDPHLTSRMAVAYIEGVQSTGVGTAVKHLVANDSEYQRHTISSEVDERTLREIYLPPFEAAVTEARSWSIMTAYNKLLGTYAGEHPMLMALLDEWGFGGFVISDWWALHSTVETTRHGVDLEMPGPALHLGAKILEAIEAGDVTVAHLDHKIRRLLVTMEALGVLDQPEHRPDTSVDLPEDRVLLRRAARDAVVLLSNDGTLPLRPDSIRRLAVIGPNADVAITQGGGSAAVNPHHAVTVLDGLRARYGDSVEITHAPGCDAYRNAPPIDPRWVRPAVDLGPEHGFTLEYFDNRELSGEPVHVAHAGSARFTWLGDPWPGLEGGDFSVRVRCTFAAPSDGVWTFTLIAGGQARVHVGGETILDMWDHWEPGTAFFGLGSAEMRHGVVLSAGEEREIVAEYACVEGLGAAALLLGALPPMADDPVAEAVGLAAEADAVVLVVGLNQDWETEGEDRISMDLPGDQPRLIREVAAANPRTVVLVNAGSPVTMDWADDVAACAQLWYLGQETGDAVADLISGDHSPTAKLPTTFPVRYEDHPAIFNYPGSSGTVYYGEELWVGYRGYELRDLAPRFPFGHGLTYSTFELGAPAVDRSTFAAGDTVTVTVPVTNTGGVRAAEVVQVYVADPVASVRRPAKELAGFAKVWLDPGESGSATIALPPRTFRFWDPVEHAWTAEAGEFVLHVGTSSAAIAHQVTVTLEP